MTSDTAFLETTGHCTSARGDALLDFVVPRVVHAVVGVVLSGHLNVLPVPVGRHDGVSNHLHRIVLLQIPALHPGAHAATLVLTLQSELDGAVLGHLQLSQVAPTIFNRQESLTAEFVWMVHFFAINFICQAARAAVTLLPFAARSTKHISPPSRYF